MTNKWIVDSCGYAIVKYSHEGQTTEGDFMFPHEFMVGIDGCNYYPCNGYSVAEIEDPRKNDCAVAMNLCDFRCQCGQH